MVYSLLLSHKKNVEIEENLWFQGSLRISRNSGFSLQNPEIAVCQEFGNTTWILFEGEELLDTSSVEVLAYYVSRGIVT